MLYVLYKILHLSSGSPNKTLHLFFRQEVDTELLSCQSSNPNQWNLKPSGSGALYLWGHNHRGQLGGIEGQKVFQYFMWRQSQLSQRYVPDLYCLANRYWKQNIQIWITVVIWYNKNPSQITITIQTSYELGRLTYIIHAGYKAHVLRKHSCTAAHGSGCWRTDNLYHLWWQSLCSR